MSNFAALKKGTTSLHFPDVYNPSYPNLIFNLTIPKSQKD
jgi:hypothetical protein